MAAVSLFWDTNRPTGKKIKDGLGFWIPRHGFRIPGTATSSRGRPRDEVAGTGFQSLSVQWNLEYGFQSLVGFLIL